MTVTPAARVPEKPVLEGLEAKWGQVWADSSTFAFVRPESREQVFSIDTPPPTVSGSLHVGHVFSYTHTDLIARHQRMRGKHVYYPIGWDDNGLPTERRVQNFYGVRCDPTVPYDPDFIRPAKPDPKKQVPISRKNFVELCHELTSVDEQTFEDLFRRVGLSVDWSLLYTTISDDSQAVAQKGFLRNHARGEAYLSEAPTMWDVTFQTAVAQAELEARDYPGAYHRVAFHRSNHEGGDPLRTPGRGSADADGSQGDKVFIETTRPELLPAAVALIAHPEDERYKDLFGSTVTSAIFGVEIPVLAHPAAEMDKGAGIAMCCTFGDLTDVTWWRELQLPTRTVIGRDGRLLRETPEWLSDSQAYAELAGKTTFSAREAMVQLLRDSGDLVGEPEPTQRKANFFEKGDKPLEIVSTRQWYITNGGRDEKLKQKFLASGHELKWVPEHMRHRYDNWVSGLNGDWLVSRQRYFGVPFPVWYRLDAEGEPDYDNPIMAEESTLPVDPSSDCPPGFDASQRGKASGFTGDPDVMDTWATSSMSPHIVCGWERDPELFKLTFPMDLNTQAHEIIRTWLFSRVVRAELENSTLPWARSMISGFVVDPDRKKMSKSKGNVVVPTDILDKFGADAVRWRAAMARPGMDSPFDESQMKVGRRLAMKVLNASKFVLGADGDPESDLVASAKVEAVSQPADLAMLAHLRTVVSEATAAFDRYDYTSALEVTEASFWSFCDDYLELVKERAYAGPDVAATESARATLVLAVGVFLRLLAPFLPFVTEEVWSWSPTWSGAGHNSVHNQPWPTPEELPEGGDSAAVADVAAALIVLRGAKSNAKVSMKTPIVSVTITGPEASLQRLKLVQTDLRSVGRITGEVIWSPGGDQIAAEVELGEAPPKR